MKKIFPIIAAALAVPSLAVPFISHELSQQPAKGTLEKFSVPKSQQPEKTTSRVVKAEGFMYEDFESIPWGEQALPEGWTATATPGYPEDIWNGGTLGYDDEPMLGVTGYCYAYILGNHKNDTAHDAWLFSPDIDLKAGVTYTVEFYAFFPFVNGSSIVESLDVHIGEGNSPSAMNTKLASIRKTSISWDQYIYEFTPDYDGTYNVGFHSITEAGSNATLIDDFKIKDGPLAAFSGWDFLDLGVTDDRKQLLSNRYGASNYGDGPLTIEFVGATEGVSCPDLPITINPGESGEFTVVANTSKLGYYQGYLTIATNDKAYPEIEIELYGSVKQSVLTGYLFEDFEDGTPSGWQLANGSMIHPAAGRESQRSFYSRNYTTNNAEFEGTGFITNYVEMGNAPAFNFWYRFTNVDMGGAYTGTTGRENMKMSVLVSEDNGITWKPVWVMAPESDIEHEPTDDFIYVSVPLTQYAGKTCLVKLDAVQLVKPGTYESVMVLVDDVEIGTKMSKDLRAVHLIGDGLMSPGTEYEFTATVENLGSTTVDDYKVELIAADREQNIVAAAQGPAIEPGQKAKVKLKWTPSYDGTTCLNARINLDGDCEPGNDLSTTLFAYVLPANNSTVTVDHGKIKPKAAAFPIDYYGVDMATQTIYTANEIGTNGCVINSITYISEFLQDFYGEVFQVYVGETDKEDFEDGKFIDKAELTQVFDGSVYVQEGPHDFVIPFVQPYEYKGGNLVVMFEKIGHSFFQFKYFRNHECDNSKSINVSSHEQGYIAEKGYTEAYPCKVYPETRFNIGKYPSGKLHGVVSDLNGPVEDATVRIAGSKLSSVTDEGGNFELAEVNAGTLRLIVEKHGYYPLTSNELTLSESSDAEYDLSIKAYPRYSVSGKIISEATGKEIPGAKITLSGYDDFTAWTDDKGLYFIDEVAGDTGSDYKLVASNSYYDAETLTVDVADNAPVDLSLREKILRPNKVVAQSLVPGTMVTWEAPSAEYRHDSGVVDHNIGFAAGWSEVVVGNVFRNWMKVKEVSWYVTDEYGEHDTFNVIIFGLDAYGNPDKERILYRADNVAYRDNEWSTHILAAPLECYGCFVSVSCSGFLGIGVCEPTDEYPFENGQSFYAGDSYRLGFTNMSYYKNVHAMVRAYGENLEESFLVADAGVDVSSLRPEVSYDIYRRNTDNYQPVWEKIGTTSETAWLDSSVPSAGIYTYSVVARYASGESDMAMAEDIKISGIVSLQDLGVGVSFTPDGSRIVIEGSDLIAHLSLVAMDGITVLSVDEPEPEIQIADLRSGIYIALISLKDKTRHSLRLLK